MQKVITGLFKARIFSAIVKSFAPPRQRFQISPSRNLRGRRIFTTRMPPTFSWTELFKGIVFLEDPLKDRVDIEEDAKQCRCKNREKCQKDEGHPDSDAHAHDDGKTVISGARTAMRISIW